MDHLRVLIRSSVAAGVIASFVGGLGSTSYAASMYVGDERVSTAVLALDGVAQDVMRRTGIPGMSIAVVHDGIQVYGKGFGVADIATGSPVDADTAFQLASVSKTVGAAVVASVIGTTDIEWTDPVVKHLPYFQLSDPYVTQHATIGDMYAMRSGLPHQAGDDIAELGYSRREVIERLSQLPLAPFRTRHLYANYSVTAGAEAVAEAVGVPWEELSRQRLYAPLGMTRTTSSIQEYRRLPNHVTLHVKSGSVWMANGTRDEQAQSPAGMVASSANDMARWMVMELANGAYGGRQVVDAAALQQTRIPRSVTTPNATPDVPAGLYGYGTAIRTDSTGRVRWQHSGAFSQGASTTFVLLPAENVGISVLTNACPIGAAEAVADTFLDIVETGTVSSDWLSVDQAIMAAAVGAPAVAPSPPAHPRPSGLLSSYVGTYTDDYYGPLVVRRSGDGLVATFGPSKLEVALLPYDGTTFGLLDGAGRPVPSATFTREAGEVTSVRLAFLTAPGQGAFVRRP